ncbi:MAG: DUF1080 domain-containing protein [Rhodothermales bacterium]
MKQLILLFALMLFAAPSSFAQEGRDPANWEIHDRERPQPRVVMPPTPGTQDKAGRPPSDAIVLFGGTGLSDWETSDGDLAPWVSTTEYFQVRPGTGGIQTKEGFGDVQLHVEWTAPKPPVGEDQDRGNSGVFLMGRYEVQVLDSYTSETYPDGQASAVYGQYPPLVNAMRAPGEWNTYDIVFTRPRFDEQGELASPAYVTVFHNGVLVQNHEELTGPSGHYARPDYEAHADRLPISLQDHDHEVRFRNIWVRDLE